MKLDREAAISLIEKQVCIDTILMKHNTQSHIAALIKRGKVLEVATNSIGTRSKGCGYDTRTIHAERAVLKKIGDISKLAGAIMIVIRISKNTGEIVNSEPCHSCKCHLEKCMRNYGLKTVYYS
jgi:hypothetical protein